MRPNERAVSSHLTTAAIGGLPSERALSLDVPDWRPDERWRRRTSEVIRRPYEREAEAFRGGGVRAFLEELWDDQGVFEAAEEDGVLVERGWAATTT